MGWRRFPPSGKSKRAAHLPGLGRPHLLVRSRWLGHRPRSPPGSAHWEHAGPLRARRPRRAGRRAGSARSRAELAGDVGRPLLGWLAGSLALSGGLPAPPPGTAWGPGPGRARRRAESPGRRHALRAAPGPGHGQRELGAQGAPRDRAAGALSQTKAPELRSLSGAGPQALGAKAAGPRGG